MQGTTDDGDGDATGSSSPSRGSGHDGVTEEATDDHSAPEPAAGLLPGPVTPSGDLMPAPASGSDDGESILEHDVPEAGSEDGAVGSMTTTSSEHAHEANALESDGAATGEPTTNVAAEVDPALPSGEAVPSPAIVQSHSDEPRSPIGTWYRNDQDRAKSVRRRANPWYRKLARIVVGLAVLTGLTIGTIFVVREIREALRSESLPPAEAETPEIRSTSFEVRSAAPAPDVDGTITLDVETGAYEFIGRGTGLQAGVQIVSPDGGSIFVRRDDGAWQLAATTDQVASDVQSVASSLADDHNVDEILTTEVRENFAEPVDRTEIGTGDDQVVRYEVVIDTGTYDAQFPLEFEQFADDAIPGASASGDLTVTMWIDDENVLVQVRDESGGWAWERLAYSEQPFTPLDPLDELLTNSLDTGEPDDEDDG